MLIVEIHRSAKLQLSNNISNPSLAPEAPRKKYPMENVSAWTVSWPHEPTCEALPAVGQLWSIGDDKEDVDDDIDGDGEPGGKLDEWTNAFFSILALITLAIDGNISCDGGIRLSVIKGQ